MSCTVCEARARTEMELPGIAKRHRGRPPGRCIPAKANKVECALVGGVDEHQSPELAVVMLPGRRSRRKTSRLGTQLLSTTPQTHLPTLLRRAQLFT